MAQALETGSRDLQLCRDQSRKCGTECRIRYDTMRCDAKWILVQMDLWI
jgi:hypothetical protein